MKKYALIIGIENYPTESGQERVKYAKNDTVEIVNYARSNGFELIDDVPILDKKATYSNIIESLDSMFNSVQADDFVLLYYAGHGYYSEYGGYLIPYDYNSKDEKNESTCISFDSIDKRLKDKKPAKFVFFLDTCHSGSAVKQIDIRGGDSSGEQRIDVNTQHIIEDQIRNMARGGSPNHFTGRVVFTSSSTLEPSRGIDEFKHGLFTHYLLHHLKSNSFQPEINIEELIKITKRDILAYSEKYNLKQTPVSYTNIQGEFYIPSYKPGGPPSDINPSKEKKLLKVILGVSILVIVTVLITAFVFVGLLNNKVFEINMLHIPEGSFLRGTRQAEINELSNHHNRNPDWLTNETPQQEIVLNSFQISKFEITNKQYGKFLEENPDHEKPACFDIEGFNNPDQPVVGVSWYDADAFCKWLSKKTKKNYRLPTEAEWEKAARGTDARTYPWGSMEPNEKIVNFSNHYGKPMPVGYFPEGAHAIYNTMEMAGNVAEWCYDWYDKDYYEFLLDVHNPEGPLSGKRKVVRGGSWKDSAFFIRCTSRISYPPDTKKNFLGFRIVLKPAN